MEAPSLMIREDEDQIDGHLLHRPVSSTEASTRAVDLLEFPGGHTSESHNGKRKVENGYDLFCVLRKRTCRQDSDGDTFPDCDNAGESDFPFNDILDEDCCCSGSDSDTYLSESSEFDIISEHVLQDLDWMGSKSLPICNFGWPNEDDGALASKLSSETQNSMLLLSLGEGNEENGVKSKEDEMLSSVSASPKECDPHICSGHSNDITCIPGIVETCSRHHIVGCINEHNNHGDNIGLETSPIYSTKTLERPSRSLSVCGSIAADRNIPLLKGNSGACSSVDEQLCVNLSSPENRDAELAQAPSTLYKEEVDDEICFSDVDAMIRRLNLLPDDSESFLNREELKHQRQTLFGLEQCTRTSIRRAIMSQGALAVLQCRDSKYFIRKREVIIGRSCGGLNVDIDLGKYGYGSKISRHQALVKVENNGSFSIKNLGKRHILVNGEKLNTGQIVSLTSCSSVDIRGLVLVFKIIKDAVRQFSKKGTLEDNTKFRWCE